ncbi:methylglyoxal synthase [Azospirillum cavernae]|uniref:Methylglyoxal synthase n=1 Tax=Azospirillum cavernae TaxID=2320860 RepID=A0A418VM99_9PROT|nr:methylglyoxal synthase [Azospirillum cavernae]
MPAVQAALISHDRLKPQFVEWVVRHRLALQPHTLFATGTTGGLIKEACPELNLTPLKSGPLGGDQQIGAMICEGNIHAMFFFIDPLTPMPHDVDVKALIRLTALYNIPTALNEATADRVIAGF